MCGIGLELTALTTPDPLNVSAPSSSFSDHPSSFQNTISTNFDHALQQKLCPRGPDAYNYQRRRLGSNSTTSNGFDLVLHTSVLHLRGDHVTPQPLVDSEESVLCWNGELFGMTGRETSISDASLDDNEFLHGSDTAWLSKRLQVAARELPTKRDMDPVVDVLRRVRGPFAVLWLHVPTQRVYFAHDRFGRRSLLYTSWGTGRCGEMIAALAGTTTSSSMTFCHTDITRFVLSNVAIEDHEHQVMPFQELPASGVFVMDLRPCETFTDETTPSYRLAFHPYAPITSSLAHSISQTEAPAHVFDRFGCKYPIQPATTTMLESTGRALLVALSNAVGVRVQSIPLRPASIDTPRSTARLAVLFSGGLDSVVLAALSNFHAPATEPVDLLTVCFDESSNYASPDRLAAEVAHAELCKLFPARPWNLIKVNVSRTELSREQCEIQALMAPCDTHMDFNIGAAFWFLSRGRGVLTTSTPAAANIATLDELNAFLQPQRGNQTDLEATVAALSLFEDHSTDTSVLQCPVICCGRTRKHGCLLRVCKMCCLKIQRAVHNLVRRKSHHVDQREVQHSRAKLLAMGISKAQLDGLIDLVNDPDDASKEAPVQQMFSCGVHRCKQPALPTVSTSVTQSGFTSSTSSPYETNARILLVGIGADEQLAGYGRHRTILIHQGEQALRMELQMDLARIWKRNLGRDDRCIAAHGREARFPYLDETVVSTISSFPISSLCDAHGPRGVGDKRVLRWVASTLGLTTCTGLAKRAIQFGSRIAKVSSTSSNRQTHGQNKFDSVL